MVSSLQCANTKMVNKTLLLVMLTVLWLSKNSEVFSKDVGTGRECVEHKHTKRCVKNLLRKTSMAGVNWEAQPAGYYENGCQRCSRGTADRWFRIRAIGSSVWSATWKIWIASKQGLVRADWHYQFLGEKKLMSQPVSQKITDTP